MKNCPTFHPHVANKDFLKELVKTLPKKVSAVCSEQACSQSPLQMLIAAAPLCVALRSDSRSAIQIAVSIGLALRPQFDGSVSALDCCQPLV
jgi:hypothetical protein